MRREFLLLGHKYNGQDVRGWFVSEKWDGLRCFYDGGISRGVLASDVPWANVVKDVRYIRPVYSTGLWTRLGKTIQAPAWFLDRLPLGLCLDGELWVDRGKFQEVMSITRTMEPDSSRWESVQFKVFDSPAYWEMFSGGLIKTPNFVKDFEPCWDWARSRIGPDKMRGKWFEERYLELQNYSINLIKQEKVTDLESQLAAVIELGGEGLMLRHPRSMWLPARSHNLLKYKPYEDGEGIVKGYTWGRGKYFGMIGAMVVEWRGKTFELCGFTNAEREVKYLAQNVPEPIGGEFINPFHATSTLFPPGSSIRFKYRELSDDGIPKEARYWR